jgi:hypothetical protein
VVLKIEYMDDRTTRVGMPCGLRSGDSGLLPGTVDTCSSLRLSAKEHASSAGCSRFPACRPQVLLLQFRTALAVALGLLAWEAAVKFGEPDSELIHNGSLVTANLVVASACLTAALAMAARLLFHVWRGAWRLGGCQAAVAAARRAVFTAPNLPPPHTPSTPPLLPSVSRACAHVLVIPTVHPASTLTHTPRPTPASQPRGQGVVCAAAAHRGAVWVRAGRAGPGPGLLPSAQRAGGGTALLLVPHPRLRLQLPALELLEHALLPVCGPGPQPDARPAARPCTAAPGRYKPAPA